MFVIGSRGSTLALWQAHFVANLLREAGHDTRIEIIKTTGDHLQTASLVQAGGKGLFTKEIEEALLAGTIDIAVHSLKDLPTAVTSGLTIAAIPAREDARDALAGKTLAELGRGARVGTSSQRRGAQLRLLRPDLQVEPIRGNVDTRLRKLDEQQFDAIVLAAAGLHRLALDRRISQYFSAEEICPAPGQGALAIQTRAEDAAREVCHRLNDPATATCVDAERLVLAHLGGGCQMPMGAYAQLAGDAMDLTAVVVSPDAANHLRVQRSAPVADYRRAAEAVSGELLSAGALSLVS